MVDPGSEEARKAWFAALDRTQEAITPTVQLTKNSSKVQYAAEKFWTLEGTQSLPIDAIAAQECL